MDGSNIIVQAGAVTSFTKMLVDIVKVSDIPSPAAVLPALALFGAFGITVLLNISDGVQMTGPVWATSALVAIAGAAGAMGLTALQNQSNKEGK